MNKTLKILVSSTPWAETENAWCILSLKGEGSGFYEEFWYPKRVCNYIQDTLLKSHGIIELPQWLYDRLFGHLEVRPKIID